MDYQPPTTIYSVNLITEAASLMSEDGENAEYDRAITELVAFSLGYTQDDLPVVADFLRSTKKVQGS